MLLPPGPRRPPALQTLAWLRDPYGWLDRCHRRFGDVFTMRLLSWEPVVFFTRPPALKEIFAGRRDALEGGSANEVLRPAVGSSSLLLLDGPRHRRDRRLLMPPLHGDRIRAYAELIASATRSAIAGWSPGSTVDVLPAMTDLSLEVITRAVFGLEGRATAPAKAVLHAFLAALTPAYLFFKPLQRDLGRGSPGRRADRARQAVDALVRRQVAARRAHPDPDASDILSLLLDARDEDGQPLSDEELRDELVTLLVAGHETTSVALAWAIRWILATPSVHERLVAEVLAAPEDQADALARLPYLDAVTSETLRIKPVINGVARKVIRPFTCGGQTWEPGTALVACIYLTHRRPELYPEPDAFRPERFLERRFGPHEYLPFGGGVRRCIGASLATYQMKIALGEVLRAVRLRPAVPGAPSEARRNVTVGPRDSRARVLERVA